MAVEISKGSMIDTIEYNSLIQKMRDFFLQKNFVEMAVQPRLSILAACEDPFTVRSFEWGCLEWPLPQTGQMWLEHELLSHPEHQGVFCISTSYRHEPNPIPGRHQTIFPMFEFESHGTIGDLLILEKELLEFLGFSSFDQILYEDACQKYRTDLIEHEQEIMLCEKVDATFLTHFPLRTDPFWNMKKGEAGLFNKVDAIVMGQETIGSAERSTNIEEMRFVFDTISGGKYRLKLYELFGKERVENEMKEYLSFDFFERSGGGIGITRLLSAMNKKALIL